MRNGFLHKKLYVGIVLISIFSYAQQPTVNINEEKNLQFQTHFFEALKQTAIKNYGKAIEQLEKCNQLDSNSVAVDFEFSKNYLLLKKYFEADIFIEKALEIEPQNMHLLSHKVAIYKAQQMFDLAINIQKELVKIKPIYNDEKILDLVLGNLLNNAIKYSPENTSIDFNIVAKKDEFIFEIIDAGIGIPLKDQKHIFERYFRAENALTSQGTGIGLNIIKGHLESLNGTISFESIENKGTKFEVKLPIIIEE